ncbi:MAG TPA: ROK family protein, partial [Verrucomicrobiae bacterium]|nr:ROK family protein [Verrucomicrobiae bacterium]
LTLGTGVGGGLILGGRLWSGIDGCAGEYGHATVEPEGHPCNCGNRGCLEQYASATAIAAQARSRAATAKGLLASLPADAIDARAVAAAALEGDEVALGIYESAGRYLGIAAATAANLLNLEALVISGGVAESFELLEPFIRVELAARAFPLPARRMEVLKGELGDNAGLLGSAAIAMSLTA